MTRQNDRDAATRSAVAAPEHAAVYPVAFGSAGNSAAADEYLKDAATLKLAQFFRDKGLPALKDEDRREQWYDDWLKYQNANHIYASLLSAKKYSSAGSGFEVFRYARFLEVCGYFSPAHGYSAQVSFLGLFAILMGRNESLKREAVAALEAGGLFAFGVSEKDHGADLLAGEFTIVETGPESFIANGSKYYIGNANVAAMIAILAKKVKDRGKTHRTRAPIALLALRPAESRGFGNVRKIHTLGVRAGFVGAFEVKDHQFPASDMIAEGREAWDAVLGTVTLGKFFLGFGSIGICEHAFEEAFAHLSCRILYGKPVIAMGHIRALTTQAFVRLCAMKLYAYRALDYVHAASESDRRYLFYCAVQKAKVSTEGVKVIAQLSECIGAKSFESDTFFEMALRDVQLVPGLEGSTHINLGAAVQFAAQYFARSGAELREPGSLVGGEVASHENPYLMEARTGPVNAVAFAPYLAAYRALSSSRNVRVFARQARAFRRFLAAATTEAAKDADLQFTMAAGQCLATIAYGQLIAENCRRLQVPEELVTAIFHFLVNDMTAQAVALAALPDLDAKRRKLARQMFAVGRTSKTQWDALAARMERR